MTHKAIPGAVNGSNFGKTSIGSFKGFINEKKLQDRPKKFSFLKPHMTLKYLLIIDFPKFDPLRAAENGFMWKSWAKMSKFIPLSLRLSGIQFSLV